VHIGHAKTALPNPISQMKYLGTEKYEVLICHFDGTNPSESAELQNSILQHFSCLKFCLTGLPIQESTFRGYVMVASNPPNYKAP
jgi:hypothetical protein